MPVALLAGSSLQAAGGMAVLGLAWAALGIVPHLKASAPAAAALPAGLAPWPG